MSTLAKSGALFELHRKRGPLELAIRFYDCRRRQLRRAIRRQTIAVLILKLRELWPWSVLNCTHLEFTRRGRMNFCRDCGHHWFPKPGLGNRPSEI
jgi:hypothetical protein